MRARAFGWCSGAKQSTSLNDEIASARTAPHSLAMTLRLINTMLGTLMLPLTLLAQHKMMPADSNLQHVLLNEVVVLRQQGISEASQHEHRASLQMPTDKLLEHIPGVQLVRRGNYAWEPTIRSLNAGQINVTIDGMHIFGACTDRMDPVSSYIEPNNLKSISVNLSPDYGNYGGSIGGGVNFKLNTPQLHSPNKVSGMVGAGYESNAQGVQTLASIAYSGKRFGLNANGIFRRAGNYRAAGGEEVLFSQYKKWNVALSGLYQLNHRHTLEASYIQDEGRDIGYPALTMDVAFANAKIGSISHHYHRHDGRLAHVETKLYYNFIDHAMDDTKRPAAQVPIHMDMPGKSWTGGFYSEASYHLHPRHVLHARVSGYRNRLTADMTMYPDEGAPMYMYTIPDAQRGFLGVDLSDKISINDRLDLAVNGTLSYNSSSIYSEAGKTQLSGMVQGNPNRADFLWNANLKAYYRFSPSWQLSANVAKTMRTASLQEFYAFYIFNRLDGFDYLGNAQLAKEQSINTNLGATFQRGIFRMETTGFGYFFSDYIAGRILPDYSVMTTGANGVKQYQNIGNAVLYGGELAVGLAFSESVKFNSVNTYTRGQDAEGYALPLISPFQSINTVFTQYKGYHFHAEMEIAAAQRHVSFERYGETTTAGSTVFNVGLRKVLRITEKELNTALFMENVFDRRYHRHLDIMKIARPGRNFVLHVAVGF